MNRGDIYLVALDPTEGHEQRGHRPVVVVPITNGGEFARRLGFAVAISGIKTTGIVRCDQPRTLDLHARNARKVDALPSQVLADVMAKVSTIFE